MELGRGVKEGSGMRVGGIEGCEVWARAKAEGGLGKVMS